MQLIATTFATNYFPKCLIIVIPSIIQVARHKLHSLFLYEKDIQSIYILVKYKWPVTKLLVRLILHLPGLSFQNFFLSSTSFPSSH